MNMGKGKGGLGGGLDSVIWKGVENRRRDWLTTVGMNEMEVGGYEGGVEMDEEGLEELGD